MREIARSRVRDGYRRTHANALLKPAEFARALGVGN